MKLNKNFITHNTSDEQIMVSAGNNNFNGFVRNNKTAADIIEMLKKKTDKDSIVKALYEKYDAPKDIIENDVESVLQKLRSIGAIDE